MILSAQQISDMREGGKILAAILRELEAMVRPGMTTKEFDVRARELMKEKGVQPSFPTVDNYPAVLCASVNEEAVHAVPSDRVLNEGDLFKIDIGVIHKGLHTDMATTIIVGGRKFFNKKYSEKKKFVSATRAALEAGIERARAGNTLDDISTAIEEVIVQNDFSVVHELGGHGIGAQLHESPWIANFRGYEDGHIKLVPGMALAIEPITSVGSNKILEGGDGHGYVIKDGALSAHFEHTIIITENDPLVVTKD
jgi:methionyl aminopeptidase